MKSKPKMQTILKGSDDLDEYSSTTFGLKIMISRRTSRDVQEQYGEVNKLLILLILWTAISNEGNFSVVKLHSLSQVHHLSSCLVPLQQTATVC